VKAFFEFVLRQWRAVSFACVAMTALGLAIGLQLPAAILPDVTFPRITVIADSGERPGEEMLRAVTRPLEVSIRRVPGVKEMRSKTSRGSTEINLDCEWSSDMDLTLQRVQAQIDATRSALPSGTSVEARLMNPTLFPVLGYSLTSDTRSLAQLRDLAELVLKPELGRLPGAAEVVVQGGRRLEARVTLDPTALEARGLRAQDVAETLQRATELRSVGLVDANRELYLGLVDARPPGLAALAEISVAVRGGQPVPLAQLGHISLEEAPEFVRYAARSREAVLLNVMRRPSASTLGLARAVHGWLAVHRKLIPADVQIEAFYDQSDLVRSSVGSVRDSLLVGALLAVVVVMLFLRSPRLGLAGAIVLPGSVALTLLGLWLTHQSLNMMTLGGMAAAVGLVLDDAIVVVEHVAHRAAARATQHGQPSSAQGHAEAMREILLPLLGSSLCTIAIFVPFILLGGVAGAFFKVLALTMTLMLCSSFVLCITFVPLVSRVRPAARRPSRGDGALGRVLEFSVRHGWAGLLAAALLVAAAIPLRASLGSGFLPEMDEGSLIIDYVSPPGTSLVETDRILREVEREITATPEIEAWSRRTGDQLGFFITEPNGGDYVLKLRQRRRRSAEEVADDLRQRIEASQPSLQIEFGQLVEDVIGDLTSNPQPIEVRVFGEDRPLSESFAQRVAQILDQVPGVVDVRSGVVVSGPNVAIVPGSTAIRLGLDAPALADGVLPAVAGLDAGQILRGARVWPIRIVLPPGGKVTAAQDLGQLRLPAAPGRWLPLAGLAEVRVEPGQTEIARDDQRTMVSVTARLSHRDLGSAMSEIQARLDHGLALPLDMSLHYGGLFEEQQASFRGLASVLAGATAAVLLILLVSFRSWRQTLGVLLVVAASLAGVLGALHVAGATFNISSFVGAIMMVGIVSENAYFLVISYRESVAQGATAVEAASAAARRRTRPVLMTIAAGIGALGPLAVGLGAGSALLKPLAVAVIGGFLVSGPLILVVLPSLLAGARGGRLGAVGAAGPNAG
jgi:multidrug efflux pump subunit AcrB